MCTNAKIGRKSTGNPQFVWTIKMHPTKRALFLLWGVMTQWFFAGAFQLNSFPIPSTNCIVNKRISTFTNQQYLLHQRKLPSERRLGSRLYDARDLSILSEDSMPALEPLNDVNNTSVESKCNTTLRVTTIPETPPKETKQRHPLVKALAENWLVLGEIFVIVLAKHYPDLGATGGPLKPEFFISKLGVFTIFFINGVALSLSSTGGSELATATKTNMLIQGFNFGFIPVFVKLFARFYPDPAFRDGLLVLACLPTTINICVAQTLAAGANMGTAIFNAIFANVLGVFLTPLLAIWMLGAGRGVSLLSTLNKLSYVVILPLVVGQIVRRTSLGAFFQKINKYSRTLSSCLLYVSFFIMFCLSSFLTLSFSILSQACYCI